MRCRIGYVDRDYIEAVRICWKVSQSYDEMRDGNRHWKVTISEIVLYISK